MKYRRLKLGETIKIGDEVCIGTCWVSADGAVGYKVADNLFDMTRRPIRKKTGKRPTTRQSTAPKRAPAQSAQIKPDCDKCVHNNDTFDCDNCIQSNILRYDAFKPA